MSYWEQKAAQENPDHFPVWTQGDGTDARGQMFKNLKFDTGLTPAAGMPLIFKNPGYVFGQILAAGIADGSITSAKILDGTITDADINAAAAIAYSKLNLANSIVSNDIVNGTIVNVDIAAAAAIAVSKLAAGTNGQMLVTEGATPQFKSIFTVLSATGGSIALTNAMADVTSATVSITPTGSLCRCVCVASFDFLMSATTTGNLTGRISLDGATFSNVAIMSDDGVNNKRNTSVAILVSNLTAAAHTIKLQAQKTNATGTATSGVNTTLVVFVADP